MAGPPYPRGLHWRSNPKFIIATVTVGFFTDIFLYGMIAPVLPFILKNRLGISEAQIQLYTSRLHSAYMGAPVLYSIPVGWLIDQVGFCQPSLLSGLVLLLTATIMLVLGQSVAVLAMARFLHGMSTSVLWTTGLTIIQDIVGIKKMGQVIGTMMSIFAVGVIVAPVLGGLRHDTVSILTVFKITMGIWAINLIMRLLVLDKKTVLQYKVPCHEQGLNEKGSQAEHEWNMMQALKGDDIVLPRNGNQDYKIHRHVGFTADIVPILHLFAEPKFLIAPLLPFSQAMLLGAIDLTAPIEAKPQSSFSLLQAGRFLVTLMVPYLALGWVAALAVDKHGTKVVIVVGYTLSVHCLVFLGLFAQNGMPGDNNKINPFCCFLVLNGVGLSIATSPGLAEAINITHRYKSAANLVYFAEEEPCAGLYGFDSLVFFAGLTVGPLLGGMLRDNFGYGVMTDVFASISGLTAILSFKLRGEMNELTRNKDVINHSLNQL